MQIFEKLAHLGHEKVLFCRDEAAGYRAIIAIHSTVLGPAVGGTRLWRYRTEDEALVDALRLSRGMTYKNAVAGLPLGGGKAVILSEVPDREAREAVFLAHGRAVETLAGRFITAEDVGTGPPDMEIIHRETEHVAGIAGKGGDPSPFTARGVFRAIQAAAKWRWGTDDLTGRTVALQGCGSVGSLLARALRKAGARLVVTDIDPSRAERVARELEATRVSPEAIFDVTADVFAPCALGGILNDETIPRLRVEIVAGAANNQLLEERHGDAIGARDILYAPDYVANAGGVMSGGLGLLGWTSGEVEEKVNGIYSTLTSVFEIAQREKIPPHRAADRLAEERLRRRSPRAPTPGTRAGDRSARD